MNRELGSQILSGCRVFWGERSGAQRIRNSFQEEVMETVRDEQEIFRHTDGKNIGVGGAGRENNSDSKQECAENNSNDDNISRRLCSSTGH